MFSSVFEINGSGMQAMELTEQGEETGALNCMYTNSVWFCIYLAGNTKLPCFSASRCGVTTFHKRIFKHLTVFKLNT